MSEDNNPKSLPPPPFFSEQPRKKNTILPGAKTRPSKPDVTTGKTYIKVPVVLGEDTVQIDISSKIDFPEPVLEIKDIKKKLKLTQCRLLLPTNKLFIKGFVRKNIQYATPTKGSKDAVVSTIHSLTTDIPFEAVAEINLIKKPKFSTNPGSQEFTFFTESPLPKGFADKDSLLSGDLSEFDQLSGESYNELPFCQLISSNFIEYDESLNREMGKVQDRDGKDIDAPFEEGTFTSLNEKMVVELTIKVLQKQQLLVDPRKRW